MGGIILSQGFLLSSSVIRRLKSMDIFILLFHTLFQQCWYLKKILGFWVKISGGWFERKSSWNFGKRKKKFKKKSSLGYKRMSPFLLLSFFEWNRLFLWISCFKVWYIKLREKVHEDIDVCLISLESRFIGK